MKGEQDEWILNYQEDKNFKLIKPLREDPIRQKVR
jgi:hypothetical protein